MKIKIFETDGVYIDPNAYGSAEIYRIILEGYTNWDEVTEDEYEALKQYILDHNNRYRCADFLQYKLTLIKESDLETIKAKSIEYYKEKIKLQKEKEEKARIKAEKTAKNKEKNDLAKKNKQLEKLANELKVKVVKE